MGGGERIASRSGAYNAPHTPCFRNGERNSPLGPHKMISRDSVFATEIKMHKVFFLILGEFLHSDPNIFHYTTQWRPTTTSHMRCSICTFSRRRDGVGNGPLSIGLRIREVSRGEKRRRRRQANFRVGEGKGED